MFERRGIMDAWIARRCDAFLCSSRELVAYAGHITIVLKPLRESSWADAALFSLLLFFSSFLLLSHLASSIHKQSGTISILHNALLSHAMTFKRNHHTQSS